MAALGTADAAASSVATAVELAAAELTIAGSEVKAVLACISPDAGALDVGAVLSALDSVALGYNLPSEAEAEISARSVVPEDVGDPAGPAAELAATS